MSDPPASNAPAPDPSAKPHVVAVERVERGTGVVDAYSAHHEELFSFLCSATRDREAAEDLLQELFLRLIREERAGRIPDAVRPWLYRVASNLVIDRGRRLTTGRRWLERLVSPESAEPADARLLRREQAGNLERALEHLSADARVALLMSGHGFSGEEIATAIGRSNNATRTLMSRARVTVRRYLGREGTAQ
jgi:RNA polymerase sigma-70 factor, ECF subfamily